MANAPSLKLRDGTAYTSNLVLTTNQDALFFTGLAGDNTADIQVSVNGAPFVSDPTLVQFDLPSFVIPNPENYPQGLTLVPGQNIIRVRTIDIVGGVSGASVITVTQVRSSEVLEVETPTAIRVRRQVDAVRILVAKPQAVSGAQGGLETSNFQGFNFYASTTEGGKTGYYKLNSSPISTSTLEYEEDAFSIGKESTTWVNDNPYQVRLRLSEVDAFGVETTTRLDTLYEVGAYRDNLRFSSNLENVALQAFLSFRHVRTEGLNADQFTSVSASSPLYYVVTAVYFDPITGVELESPYSQEVLGTPLVIDTTLRDLPRRTASQISLDFISAVMRTNEEISLVPGSTTKDVSIDPFASEAERLYFLLDFVHRGHSFLTLIPVDDPNGDGVSDAISASAYKIALKAALGVSSDTAVQGLIDAAFDKLAGNAACPRLPGRAAVGQVVFYTYTRPTFDLTIPNGTVVYTDADTSLGIPSVRFRVGGTYVLPAANASAFYNFSKKRYEITVDVLSETVGSDGNRPAGQIKGSSGVTGLQVINEEATVFGRDRESNADLAARAMLAFVGVDAGTEGGYRRTTSSQVGIIKSKIIKSGDKLMMRDYDPLRKKHIGGKVDIYVHGLKERSVTETFAFSFEIARNIACQLLDLATLTFRVLDSRVTPDNPITEILDNPSQGFGVRNVTQGLDYDLTGVTLLDYHTFRLNAALPTQPVTGIDDIVQADYRFRVVNEFVFGVQPVRRITSVVGEVSGSLDPQVGYSLYKTEDPLLNGESTLARDYLTIQQVGGIPSGDSIVVNDEVHALVGFNEIPLKSIGVNSQTIRVFSSDRSTEYEGPGALVPDFGIIEGTPTTPVRIVRTANTTIPNGSSVSVDYVHDENFTVTYVVNDVIQGLQRVLDQMRHVTGDVLAKEAVGNAITLDLTMRLKPGAQRDRVDPAARTNASLEISKKGIGQGAAQSDIIHAVESASGVDYLVVPFAKMAYADGSRKIRESLSSNYLPVPSLSAGANSAFILTSPLQFPTTNGGGEVTEHRGVFRADVPMHLAASLSSVSSSAYSAWIIGSDGASIAGYSDTETLTSAGFTTTEAQRVEALRRTANHVVLSLPSGGDPEETPTDHAYSCSYMIRGDSGAKDFTASAVEYLTLGDVTITVAG